VHAADRVDVVRSRCPDLGCGAISQQRESAIGGLEDALPARRRALPARRRALAAGKRALAARGRRALAGRNGFEVAGANPQAWREDGQTVYRFFVLASAVISSELLAPARPARRQTLSCSIQRRSDRVRSPRIT
jgi:hypothetical protein